MSSRLLTALFAATALLTTACDDDSTGLDDDESLVRFINASPAVGEVDLLVGGNVQTNASDVTFGNASAQCVVVDADESGLTFQQSGGSVTIPSQTFAFDAGGRNTVIVAGSGSTNLRVLTFSDPFTPELDVDEARIRVVNGRATTAMNVTVTPWNQTPGTPTTIAASATPATAATGWVVVPAGEPVAVRLTTTAGALIDVLNFVPMAGQELILVAGDPVSGAIQWSIGEACPRR